MPGARAIRSIDLFGTDPIPWLLDSGEAAARWLTLTALLDRPPDDADVVAARCAVLADPGTAELIARLPDWEAGVPLSGHDSPGFAPNLLGLLADMGVAAGDSPRVDAVLGAMLRHQDEAGRFATYAVGRTSPTPAWGALLCDNHAIVDTLVRFGLGGERAVERAVDRMAADLVSTPQGSGWPCVPSLGFRGPGRKADVCPQVTVEALRAIARVSGERSDAFAGTATSLRAAAAGAARTLLAVWRTRGAERPYMFGHGYSFKTVKWPPFWYSVLGVVDAVGRYPELWRSEPAGGDARASIAELAACLVAYNVGGDGRVTPRSCYRGFERFSFGQKKEPSPFATALVAATLRRLDDLAADVAAVDVRALGSSRGGSGTARPPRT